jgi:hypothetical protein
LISVLVLAGRAFRFLPTEPGAPSVLPDSYRLFESASDALPFGAYEVLAPDTPRLPGLITPPFWSNEVWRMGERDDRVVIEIYHVMNSRWTPVANLSPDFATGTIQPFAGRRAAPSAHAVNYPYDQAILINRLLQAGVLVVHGSAVVIDGRGYLFFGPSGAGKTTISRWWKDKGALLLNDDRVAVYRDPAGVWQVAGTPWHGEEPVVCPTSAPLHGVVRLRQAHQNRVTALDPVMALAELTACSLVPFFSRTSIDQAMALLESLAEHVALTAFHFRHDRSALETFRAAAVP